MFIFDIKPNHVYTYICSFSSCIYISDRRWMTSFFLVPSFIFNVKENTLKSMVASIIGCFSLCEIENHWHSHSECHRTKWKLYNEKNLWECTFPSTQLKRFFQCNQLLETESLEYGWFLTRNRKHIMSIGYWEKTVSLAPWYLILLNFHIWSNNNCIFLIFCP